MHLLLWCRYATRDVNKAIRLEAKATDDKAKARGHEAKAKVPRPRPRPRPRPKKNNTIFNL